MPPYFQHFQQRNYICCTKLKWLGLLFHPLKMDLYNMTVEINHSTQIGQDHIKYTEFVKTIICILTILEIIITGVDLLMLPSFRDQTYVGPPHCAHKTLSLNCDL